MNRNTFAICLSLLLPACGLVAQPAKLYTTDSAAVYRATVLVVHPQVNTGIIPKEALPFSGITFRDVRYDTTVMAIFGKSTFLRSQFLQSQKINLEDGLATGLTRLFNKAYARRNSNGSAELVIFIRQWMARRKEQLSERYSGHENQVQLRLEAEAFLNDGDRYYPAFFVDTTLTAMISIKEKFIPGEITSDLINPAIAALQQKLAGIGNALLTQKISYTAEYIHDRYYVQRFGLPVLTSGTCSKGIFRTLEEFTNNQPSITECLVTETKNGATRFTDANGNDINPLRVFGYCDGKRMWIQRGPYASPLIRVGNGFEYFVQLTNGTRLLQSLNMDAAVTHR